MAEAKVKKVPMLSVSYNEHDVNLITFAVTNETPIVVDMREFSPSIREQAMRHGFNQKIRDAAAGFTASKDGKRAADPRGARDEMMKVIDSLKADAWDRKGSGGGTNYDQYLNEAVARLKKITIERANKALEGYDAEKRKALIEQPKVKAEIQQIIADNLKAKLTAEEDPLAGLEFGEDDETDETEE